MPEPRDDSGYGVQLPEEQYQLLAELTKVLNKLEDAGWKAWPSYGQIVRDDRMGPRVTRVVDVIEGATWVIGDE